MYVKFNNLTDEDIRIYYSDKKIVLWENIPQEHKNYLNNRFCDSESYKESVWRILYHIEERPVCPICGTKLRFYGKPNLIFAKTCSRKCGSILSQRKREQTCLDKYGVAHPIQNKDVQNKQISTCLEKYGVDNYYKSDKIKQIRLQKYGVEYLLQSSKIREKINKTFNEKYGYSTPAKNDSIKKKIKNTCLTKYGVDNVRKAKCIQDNIVSKTYNTKKHNNTFNTSKSEDESYAILKERYPNVITQYKDARYPFACDFYIPSLDLFIECNYHWTHGGKPYEGTDDDKQIVEKWKEKNTKFYNNAIQTWTVRDVNKRNTVKENKLNYIEFWNIDDLKTWMTKTL